MRSRLHRWASVLLGYTVLVILWGAWVRVTGSGAGCSDHWPLCNGELIPRQPRLETLIELTHRVTSGLAGVGSIIVLWLARRDCEQGHPARRAAVWGLVFMLLEGAVGAMLVKLELVAQNTSNLRGLVVGLHLANTLLLLAAQTLTVHYAAGNRPIAWRGQGSVGLGIAVAWLATILVASTGAITALGDTLFPAASLAEGIAQDLDPAAHLLVRLRVVHPVLAVVVAGYLLFFANYVRYARPDPRVVRWSWVLNALFLLQVGVGGMNLLLLAPGWLQILHLLLADALWIALVLLGAHALRAQDTAHTALAPAPVSG